MVPNLSAFFPEGAPPGASGWGEGLFRAPRFGAAWRPVALLTADGPDPVAAAIAAGLARAAVDAPARAEARSVMAGLRAGRVGGAPGLPDPGPAALDLAPGRAVLVLDPGRPAQAAAAAAMLAGAQAAMGGRPLLLALDPDAPDGAWPVLRATGLRCLPGRLSPWTLLEVAAKLHTLSPAMALLAGAAGVPARLGGAPPWGGTPPEAAMAAVLAATRWADPFRDRPWTAEEGIAQLAEWRRAEAANRRIVACTGMDVFKQDVIRAALASQGPPPVIHWRASAALRHAQRAGGDVAVWAAVMPADLPARAAAVGVGLARMEDGFIRSAGLGVHRARASSLVMDSSGIHYDPATVSALEQVLATTAFDRALLARAARLRHALRATGVTKYNLVGEARLPSLPPGRRVILVPGQVEDDAAIRRGGGRIRTNLSLLRAVRAENPDAVILWKPHPDVEAGMRRGAVSDWDAAGLADHVLREVPIAPLYAMAQEVHCISSLSGFEALLRGLRVVTWGQPFYAGWGLTEDRDPPPRRGRRLTIDELVAGALILHLRCRDPVTGLPCPPEVLVERLAERRAGPPPRPRIPAPVRAFVARCSRLLAELGARL